MAGLPYKVSALLRNDSVSFLRRSQYHQLGRITDVEIANAFRKTIEAGGRSITPEALEDAVKAVDGFPYMMQLVGYRTWDVSENSPKSAHLMSSKVPCSHAWSCAIEFSKQHIESFPIKTLSFCSRCCPILAPAGSRR